MYLARTSFAYDEAVAHVQRVGANPLIESHLVQYLLVSFYAEVEERIRAIMADRVSRVQDRKVAHFVVLMSEGMFRRVKKSDINDMLSKFACGEGDLLAQHLGDMNLQPYFVAIINRHKVSHDQGSTMTLSDFGRALPCGEAIIGAVRQILELP